MPQEIKNSLKHIVTSDILGPRYRVHWVAKGADNISPESGVRENTGIIFS